MKQILVPTDFSECAGNAIDFAIQTSKIFSVEITLLHSYEVNSSLYTDYMGVNKGFNQSLLNSANEKLDQLKESIEAKSGVVVKTFLSTDSLNESIKSYLSNNKIDIIIMGTLGAGGIKAKLWGSQTSSVIGESGVPVLAIPHDYKWKKPGKMLFATNQFEKDKATLNYVFELAGLYMAIVQVAVFTDEDDDKAIQYLDHGRKISEYETYLKENYKEETLTSAHIYGEKFEETLQDYIMENNVDILIMVTYQQSFWKRIFNPSKTKRMSYNTNIPLLAIPGKISK